MSMSALDSLQACFFVSHTLTDLQTQCILSMAEGIRARTLDGIFS